jgi:hypothetical protein
MTCQKVKKSKKNGLSAHSDKDWSKFLFDI